MNSISRDQAEAAWDYLASLTDEETVEGLIDTMAEEQPEAMAYLMSMGEDDFNEDEQELLLFLGIWMWKLLTDTGILAKEMTEKTLDGVQSKNLPLLEDLTENYPGDFDRLVNLAVKDHAQPEVIRVMAEIIEEEDEEVIRIKNRSDVLVYLRILLDGFLKTGA